MSKLRNNSTYLAHVAHDEKFIDRGYREFEAVVPGQNRFLMRGKSRPLQFVKNTPVHFCSLRQIKTLFNDEQCAAIIFHSLWEFTLLKHAPTNKPVVWIGWGYDYYGTLLSGAYPDGLLLPRTLEILNTKPLDWKSIFLKCANVAKRITGRFACHPKLLAKVDIFSPVIDLEYQMACKLNSWFKAKYIPWDYGIVESDLSVGGMSVEKPGSNILVGNSASYENNHMEVFELLERYVNLSDRIIIVPLSYGGDKWYRDKVISLGTKKFGDQFIPLTDFIERDEYISLLQSCGHAFMNHLRQQAGDNISIIMLNGGKIYMNRRNPLYQWLAAEGAMIESIDTIAQLSAAKKTLMPLSRYNRQKNVEVVNKHWGRGAQRAKTRQLVYALLNKGQKDQE